MKCNPNPVVIKTLASLNIGFDCASEVSTNIFPVNPLRTRTFQIPENYSRVKLLEEKDYTLISDSSDSVISLKLCMPHAPTVGRSHD